MPVEYFAFNPFSTNCYVVHDRGEAAIIDPSCYFEAEVSRLVDYIDANELSVKHLLLTHGHLDHIFGCNAVSDQYGLDWRIHAEDVMLLNSAQTQAQMFGIPIDPPKTSGQALRIGERLRIGEIELEVLHTPGHSPGSVSFVEADKRFVIAGDVLFHGSIGRTDLWQGSLPILMESIFQRLVPLGDDFTVYPGHGPQTTIGHEVASNPFLTEDGGFAF